MFIVVMCHVSRPGARRPLPFNNLKLRSQLGRGALAGEAN